MPRLCASVLTFAVLPWIGAPPLERLRVAPADELREGGLDLLGRELLGGELVQAVLARKPGAVPTDGLTERPLKRTASDGQRGSGVAGHREVNDLEGELGFGSPGSDPRARELGARMEPGVWVGFEHVDRPRRREAEVKAPVITELQDSERVDRGPLDLGDQFVIEIFRERRAV